MFCLPIIALLTLKQHVPEADLAKALGAMAYSQDGLRIVERPRSDLQVQNASGNLIPAEAGLVDRVILDNRKVVLDRVLLGYEIDSALDWALAEGWQVDRLGIGFGGSEPPTYRLTMRHVPLDRISVAALSKELKRTVEAPISEGLMRSGSKPKTDWKVVQSLIGLPLEVTGTGVARAAGSQFEVRFYGCPCGKTVIDGWETVVASSLDSSLRRIRANRLNIYSIEPCGSGHQIRFSGEGEATDLAKRVRGVNRSLPQP